MYIFTPSNKKYIQNRLTWIYFIIRNITFYGKPPLLTLALGSIPLEIVIAIFVLLLFQELSGKIHDAYIQGLKHQSKLVSTIRALSSLP